MNKIETLTWELASEKCFTILPQKNDSAFNFI